MKKQRKSTLRLDATTIRNLRTDVGTVAGGMRPLPFTLQFACTKGCIPTGQDSSQCYSNEC